LCHVAAEGFVTDSTLTLTIRDAFPVSPGAGGLLEPKGTVTNPNMPKRACTATQPEDDFVELFAQVFGFEKTQLLAPEYPVADIYGTTRYIDFALNAAGRMVAFEVDGPTH
jgi:hypothetical protein